MVSVNKMHNKTIGFVLLSIIVFFCYVGIVDIVNGFRPVGLLKSLTVQSSTNPDSSCEFVMGDTLAVVATSDSAGWYRLRIYQNSSIVLEKSGVFNESKAEAFVSLNPPMFNAGGEYVLVFDGYSCNNPIPGVQFADSGVFVFNTVGAKAKIELRASFYPRSRCINLCTNLTDVDGCFSIANEKIGFKVRSANRKRVTDGWIPLDFAQTDSNGIAKKVMALSVRDGNYSLMVYHEGNRNFGYCEKVINVEVVSSQIAENSGLNPCLDVGSMNSFSYAPLSYGSLIIDPCSYTPYALLPTTVEAQYTATGWLKTTYVGMVFFLDSVNSAGYIDMNIFEVEREPPYVYEGILYRYCFEVIGSHRLIVGMAKNNDLQRLQDNARNGIGIFDQKYVDLAFQRCPSDLIIYCPEAVYDDDLNVAVALAMPRAYEETRDDFCVASSLASKFQYNDVTYAVDESVSSALIKLHANDTSTFENFTDSKGIAFFRLAPNSSDARFSLKLNAVVDGSSTLFVGSDERNFSFSRVSVLDSLTPEDGLFKFNYTVEGLNLDGDAYVGGQHSLKVNASLPDKPACNIPVSTICAKFLSSSKTLFGTKPGFIPSGSDLVRVTYYFDDTALWGDIDCSGEVDISDMILVSMALGSYPGHPNWYPDADIAPQWELIDVCDVGTVEYFYGQEGVYYPFVSGLSLRFDTGQEVFVDTQGCVRIPSGAANFTVWKGGVAVGALVEFFEVESDETSWTNNVGEAVDFWCPSCVGKYLVQVRLPPSFDLFVSSWGGGLEVDGLLNLVSYFEVVKRPVMLDIEYVPENATKEDVVTLVTHCYDVVLNEPAPSQPLDVYLWIWYNASRVHIASLQSNSSGVATYSFDPETLNDEFDNLLWLFDFTVEGAVTSYTWWDEEGNSGLGGWSNHVVVDLKFPTHLEFDGNESSVISASVGFQTELGFKLSRLDSGMSVFDRIVQLDVNGTKFSNSTNSGGMVSFYWTPLSAGVYYLEAVHDPVFHINGSDWSKADCKRSNLVRLVAVAAVTRVFVEFAVQPRKFKPGASVTLSARVLDAVSGDPKPNCLVRFYRVDASNNSSPIDGNHYTDSEGLASQPYAYPSSGVYAFKVELVAENILVTSPVQLTVSAGTALTLNVEKGEDAFSHVFSGRLLSDGAGVPNKLVKIAVNGSVKDDNHTSSGGEFSFALNLPPINNKATEYQVQVTFEGYGNSSATAYSNVNGTDYAVCTTIQYGYKPSSNSTMLTVEPQATQVMQPTKTPEQMQKEAEQSGWFRVEPEFSWWYPWFRLHFKLNVNLPQGNPAIDYGWSLLPFGESYNANNIVLANILNDGSNEIQTNILVDYMVGVIIQFGTAVILGRTGIWTAVAILAYVGYSLASAWLTYANSGGSPKAWLIAFISSAITGTGGLVLSGINSVSGVLTSVARFVFNKINFAMHSLWAKGLNFFDITGVAFALIDFAFMILYLSMYLASI